MAFVTHHQADLQVAKEAAASFSTINAEALRSGRCMPLRAPSILAPSFEFECSGFGMPKRDLAPAIEIGQFYATATGYQFPWGQLIEEDCGTSTSYHFVPTCLVEAGAQLQALRIVAADWSRAMEPFFGDIATSADGPDFVPLTLSVKNDPGRDWLIEAFFKCYWASLIDTWFDKAITQQDDFAAAANDASDVRRIPVQLVYSLVTPHSGQSCDAGVNLVIVSSEDDGAPRFCMATYTPAHGYTCSKWIDLPPEAREFDAPAVDYILDFHKGAGGVVIKKEVQSDLSDVPGVIQELLLSVQPPPSPPAREVPVQDPLQLSA